MVGALGAAREERERLEELFVVKYVMVVQVTTQSSRQGRRYPYLGRSCPD